MDQDLIAYLDQHFSGIYLRLDRSDQRFDSIDQRLDKTDQRWEKNDQRMEGLETGVRTAHVAIEDLRDQVRFVAAEGVANILEQLKRYQEEIAQKFREIEAFNRLAYQDLYLRVRKLEST
jgi:chromosome segregation ATPase